MRWQDVLAVPPRAEPIHIEEARRHLRLTEDDPRDEDALIEAWIAAAREAAEGETGRQLVLATRELRLDAFPSCRAIILPHPPLREVVSITYTDDGGNVHTMSLDDVIVDTTSEPGRIVLRSGKAWPSTNLQATDGVVIRYRAGHAVPFTATTVTSTVNALDHPFHDGDLVRLWNSGGALPAPLKERTDYFVVNVNGHTFQLSESDGGSPIAITDEGAGSHFIGLIPESIRAAMKLTLGSRFEHREDIIVGAIGSELPQAARSLLWLHKVWYSGPVGVT